MSDKPNYDLDKYVSDKLRKLQESDKDLRSVFLLMTGEPEKIFAESNDGYNITKITYGEYRERTERMAGSLSVVLGNVAPGSFVGIYMNNSEQWLEIFWALLMLGYRPLLVNNRMSRSVLEDIISQYGVKAVISDAGELGNNTVALDDLMRVYKDEKTVPVKAEKDGWADEIALMSSGTTSNVKICIYNGETMYYQICDSARIIRECKQVKAHCEGSLKQLTFLPFYHVFGLVAVFMWFGYFDRTFVFLKDFSSETILNTVRRHKVTHIFSIPLLWNTIYDTVIRTAKQRGEYDKLMKGIAVSEKLAGVPLLGKLFTKVAFKSVREQIFGDSIRFLISGGSAISEDVLRFFNAIGYHLANGYGMTEIGITSVELSSSRKNLTDRSVGIPFSSIEYKISDKGELLVRGKTMADIVMENGKEVDHTEDGWFCTGDFAEEKNGRYFILGRSDDVIIGASGENINPDVLEEKIKIEGAEEICIVSRNSGENKIPVLLVRVSPYSSAQTVKNMQDKALSCLKQMDLDKTIGRVMVTTDSLMEANDFKLNRRKIAERLESGSIKAADPEKAGAEVNEFTGRVAEIIGSVIGKRTEEIRPNADIFFDLGVTSLDYYSIIMELAKEFRVSFPKDNEMSFKTAAEFADYIEKHR